MRGGELGSSSAFLLEWVVLSLEVLGEVAAELLLDPRGGW